MRHLQLALCLLLVVPLKQALAQSAPGADSALVSAATQEGKVVLYTPTDPKNTQPLVSDFQSLYPGIAVDVIHMSTTELYSRFLAQAAAGDHSADVLWSDAMDLQMKLVSQGYAMTYASPEEKALPSWAVYKDEAYATTLMPSVIVYNKRLLAGYTLPTTHGGFVKFLNDNASAFKSKVTTYDLKTSGAGYLLANADIKQWKNYWSLIAAQGKVGAQYYPSGGLMVEMIASGQYALGYNLPYAYAVLRQKVDPNMGIAFTSGDYVLASSRIGFIAASAPHPNAAKLFLNYLISKRGQDVTANQAALGAVRADATGAMTVAALDKQLGNRLIPVPVDLALLKPLTPTKRLAFLNKWNQLARGNGGQ